MPSDNFKTFPIHTHRDFKDKTSCETYVYLLLTYYCNLTSKENEFYYINLPPTDSKPIVHFKLQCKH